MTEVNFKGIGNLVVLEEGEAVTNQFTGVIVDLEPEAVALYDYIKGCEMMARYKSLEKGLSAFRKRWPEAYMDLLD